MKLNLAVLEGDGIGPEVTSEAIKVLRSIAKIHNHTFSFRKALIGAAAIDQTGTPLPDATLKLCLDSDAVLFGAIGDPKYDNNPNARIRPEQGLLKLRKALGLYANLRPIRAYPTLLSKSPLKPEIIEGTDILIFRELTGGIYFGDKKRSEAGDYASDLCAYSAKEIERVTHLAFQAAETRKGKLTLVDKANVLETSRLWRKIVSDMASQYPTVDLDFLFVDNAAMQLILNPKQFDVILTENMFGDILSDEASVIGGSIGLLASASVGDQNYLFEPIHGSYPQATNKGIANPIAAILSAAMLLSHFKLQQEADIIYQGVETALREQYTTPDLNTQNPKSTAAVGDFIAKLIENKAQSSQNLNPKNMGQSSIMRKI